VAELFDLTMMLARSLAACRSIRGTWLRAVSDGRA